MAPQSRVKMILYFLYLALTNFNNIIIIMHTQAVTSLGQESCCTAPCEPVFSFDLFSSSRWKKVVSPSIVVTFRPYLMPSHLGHTDQWLWVSICFWSQLSNNKAASSPFLIYSDLKFPLTSFTISHLTQKLILVLVKTLPFMYGCTSVKSLSLCVFIFLLCQSSSFSSE